MIKKLSEIVKVSFKAKNDRTGTTTDTVQPKPTKGKSSSDPDKGVKVDNTVAKQVKVASDVAKGYDAKWKTEIFGEDQLDEISANKLHRYIDKSETDQNHRQYERPTTSKGHSDWKRKYKNRNKGLGTAIDKLSGKKDRVKVQSTNEEHLGFAKLAKKVHSKALAAWIGRKKEGDSSFAAKAAKGREKK